MLNDRVLRELIFWGVWLLIPFLWEIFTGIASAVFVLLKFLKPGKEESEYSAEVTLLIPVYNSEHTLGVCLKSIKEQDYPAEKMEVILIDNGSTDGSYRIFEQFQQDSKPLRLWWHSSRQGKSKALNKGIFSSTGKYIINIDSDGILDKKAVRSMVARFEAGEDIGGMTGVVLINSVMIEETKDWLLRLLQRNEFFEYAESFLVGRNYFSSFNAMYTFSGAFSAFRRDALVKTQMYSSETLGEDTHMTFQLKKFGGGKALLCETAFFYTDPIESLDRLYIQRQRWQRGELEVASLFIEEHTGGIRGFIRKPTMRQIISDHTLAFPRLVWFFAMLYLYFINYPLRLLVGANLLLYGLYVLNSLVYMGAAALYLRPQPETRRYLLRHWYVCFMLPLYRFVVYWIRLAGIINSHSAQSQWKTSTLTQEVGTVRSELVRKTRQRLPFLWTLRKWINRE